MILARIKQPVPVIPLSIMFKQSVRLLACTIYIVHDNFYSIVLSQVIH